MEQPNCPFSPNLSSDSLSSTLIIGLSRSGEVWWDYLIRTDQTGPRLSDRSPGQSISPKRPRVACDVTDRPRTAICPGTPTNADSSTSYDKKQSIDRAIVWTCTSVCEYKSGLTLLFENSPICASWTL